MCIANIKFLCLTLCKGEVCTDDNADADTDANDDGQFVMFLALWLINQMSQKQENLSFKVQ